MNFLEKIQEVLQRPRTRTNLASRKVKVGVLTMLLTAAGSYFKIDPELIHLVIQLGAVFIAGQSIADFGAQGTIPSGSPDKAWGVKFLVYMLTTCIVAAGTYFTLPPDLLQDLANIVSVFILGQGVADAGEQGMRKLNELTKFNASPPAAPVNTATPEAAPQAAQIPQTPTQ